MDGVLFSVIIWAKDVNKTFFRDCLESLVAADYENWELIILDETAYSGIDELSEEFFPSEQRVHYYRIRRGRGMGYAYNMGLHFARGKYLMFVGRHDRLSTRAFREYEKVILDTDADIIYSDHDEISGVDRLNPIFKPDLNKELLRHFNYIGDHILIKVSALNKTGTFRENLDSAALYDILLRATEKKLKFIHIPLHLYHMRVYFEPRTKQEAKLLQEKVYREHMTVAGAHLKRSGVEAQIIPNKRLNYWNIDYDGSDYRYYRREYVVMREKKCRPISRKAVEKMYGHLKQPDVAIVGGAILKNYLTFDNCGYIFSKEGFVFPACNGHSVLHEGYMGRNVLSQEVSMVDLSYAIIDKKVYKKLGGFNPNLVGRDRVLDFCLKVRRAGYRIIFEPSVKIIRRKNEIISSEDSHEALMRKWEETIAKGDPYYNKELPIGLDNYFI